MAGKGRPKGQGNIERESMSEMRLVEVQEAMLSGRSRGWCEETFAAKWKVTERQIRNYIARAEEAWRVRAQLATPELRAQALERVEMLIRQAGEDRQAVPGAYAAYRGAIDMHNKLTGAYTPVKVEHSGTLDVSTLTPEQRRLRMAELAAKAAARADGG
jgi:hypothetical protein